MIAAELRIAIEIILLVVLALLAAGIYQVAKQAVKRRHESLPPPDEYYAARFDDLLKEHERMTVEDRIARNKARDKVVPPD